ncbi:MAG: FHA domain-containing protein, partial [Acidobacteria bacterium]|nr:FHA domain-containing protein [Acidobacteriota bacterium]
MNRQNQLINPRLISISGPDKGGVFNITNEDMPIGREASNAISISDPLLSRRHCRITREGEQFTLRDLGSANGTFVNGVPVKERLLLHRDVIKVGESLMLFLCHEDDDKPTEDSVELNDDDLITQSTIVLPQGEGFYLNSKKVLPMTARTARNLQAILRIALEINTIRDLHSLQKRLLELIFSVIPAERGAILLKHTLSDEISSSFGWSRTAPQIQPVTASRTIVQQVLREGLAILRNDVAEDAMLQASKSLLHSGIRSILAVPLSHLENIFGVIYLDNTNPLEKFDEEHLQLVTAIANLASVALENANYIEQLNDETKRLQDELSLDRKMIGESRQMQAVREFIARVAPTHSTVLVRG